jgi:hypothetical protein
MTTLPKTAEQIREMPAGMSKVLCCQWPTCFKRLPLGENSNKRIYCTYHQKLSIAGEVNGEVGL